MFARMTVYAGCIVVGTPATLNYSSCAQFGNGTPIGRRQSLWLTKSSCLAREKGLRCPTVCPAETQYANGHTFRSTEEQWPGPAVQRVVSFVCPSLGEFSLS
jgi:hypothetical protein